VLQENKSLVVTLRDKALDFMSRSIIEVYLGDKDGASS
jgi:hypothetical protein